jgi:hypothetical protein
VNPKIVRFIKHFLYGALAAGWNGGWAAVVASGGLGIGSQADPTIPEPSIKILCVLWASAFVMRVALYFWKNPLPEKLPDSSPQ